MIGLRPFFGYYGGKWRDALTYPEPRCARIIEPFAGSAGYSLRYYDRKIVLCELDPVIFGVWDFIIRAKSSEILNLPDIPTQGSLDDFPKLCPESKALIGLWLNRGVARPRKSPSKWMRDGIRPSSFWGQSVRDRIALQVERIRHWKIYNTSYQNLRLTSRSTWFVDPPYESAGQHYKFGSSRIDYVHLGEWCKSRDGQVIVCENTTARWLPFVPHAETKTTRRQSRSSEAIWSMETQSS